MRSVYLLAIPASLLAAAAMWACSSSSGNSNFNNNNNGGDSGDDATDDGGTDDSGDDGCGILGCSGDTAPQCVNLQCKAQDCTPQGKPQTTLTGTVYDPAGNLPLYNVYVYIPNSTPDPIKGGDPTCTQCEAPASGSPLIGALTDANGKFTIKKGPQDQWGVPGGDNIPLVMQSGKWRRQVTIPHVDDCATTDLNQVLGKDKLRLPKNGKEGDMPYIALTTGCDPAECFLLHIGIDPAEFGPPDPTGWAKGKPHVNVYQGQGGGSAFTGGNTYTQTYAWWADQKNLLKYDIMFDACECSPYDRGPGAYAAVQNFLDNGGRLFATHYYYNWFATPTGQPVFNTVVQWVPGGANPFFPGVFFANSTFPKGQAYADWLIGNAIGTKATQSAKPGYTAQIDLQDIRYDIDQSGPPTYPKSSKWIYSTNSNADDATYDSMYVSFDTPVGQPVQKQCGRAVFSDVHLSGSSDGQMLSPSTIGSHCAGADPGNTHATDEKALEFLFFDLSSCVQNNSQPPQPPNPQ